jgi:solute carrier family 35, member F5
MLAMVPNLVKSAYRLRRDGLWDEQVQWVKDRYQRGGLRLILQEDDLGAEIDEQQSFLKASDRENDGDDEAAPSSLRPDARPVRQRTHLAVLPTARLSFFFCFLWFTANYFAMACLKYTTVASATILTSTSSIFTLLIGALTRTEKFTWRKMMGVMASLAGIVLISKVDLGGSASKQSSPESQAQRRALDEFPNKTPGELFLGDSLALFSAMIYGVYTITLKRTTLLHHPLQLNMPLFFGLVGTFNFFLLLPLFPILHFTGIEPFALPPTQRIWTILLINSASSLLSDICWAYAMILTSPLVVTVGLSLTIPLSLVGEMIIQGRFESWVYWVGACIVVGSFIFVDREEKEDEAEVLEANLDIRRRKRSESLSLSLSLSASGAGIENGSASSSRIDEDDRT